MATIAPAAADLRVHADLKVQTVSRYSEFLELEPIWDRLLHAAPRENPFLEFSWMRTWSP